MTIEFTQNGNKKRLRTPRNSSSFVTIKNMKKVICIVVRKNKKILEEKRKLKLKALGENLFFDRIGLVAYYEEKEKIKIKNRRKKIFTIKIKKDKNSIVKIQNEFFENKIPTIIQHRKVKE